MARGICGGPWRSTEVHGGLWRSMDLHGGPWRSMEVHGYPWISMDSHGIWISIGFRGNSQVFVDFRIFSSILMNFLWGRSNWLKIAKNNFLRFLPFYPLISAFQALSCLANDRSRRDLSFGIENSWFHGIWLGIEPFLCFSVYFKSVSYTHLTLPTICSV